jgi:hypothetical protein
VKEGIKERSLPNLHSRFLGVIGNIKPPTIWGTVGNRWPEEYSDKKRQKCLPKCPSSVADPDGNTRSRIPDLNFSILDPGSLNQGHKARIRIQIVSDPGYRGQKITGSRNTGSKKHTKKYPFL